ncbi:MAG TPA: universal stress protein [Burkholderiales bacterium]|nr:universal stress protein [Burkholderiales bacterium]
MKILLAADGSSHSNKATQALIKHVAFYKHPPEVLLIYVHLPVPNLPGMGKIVSKDMINHYYRDESEEALAASKRILEDAKTAYQTKTLVGPVAETIVKQAHANNCELIYMGTRGMGGLKNVLLGSNAVKVLHIARIPVVLVK